MLFEPQRHEPVTDQSWNANLAREVIVRIVSDTSAAFAGDQLWPVHPLDISPERPSDALKPLFNGAAGVIWALQRLHALGAADSPGQNFLPHVRTLLDRQHQDDGALQRDRTLSFPLGDVGILLLHWTLEPTATLADQLHQAITANINHATQGWAWGSPGTMLAALFVYERTHDERWRELFLRNCDQLWQSWQYNEAIGGYLWSQDLYGHRDQHLCALHGLAGIVFALHRGRALLDRARHQELVSRTVLTLPRTALREGNYVNWPMLVGESTRPTAQEPQAPLLQHCIGAPGVINCVAPMLDAMPADGRNETSELLVAAAELIWHAGPTIKLPSLCHGAPGSGYAFLRLFAATDDERWLHRARRFAMHAVAQADRALQQHGQRKFSLWTGDLGLALYLWDCVRERAEIPLLDVF